MPTAYTSLLGLALPVSGDLTGTWGDTVNNAITSLLDTAVAGTTTLSADADVTLTDTTGAANQARAAVLRWTANGSVTRSITAPARSKAYIVINDTAGTQSIVLRGAGPTTGVTVAAAERALVVWNGTDFTKVSSGGGSGAGSTTLISETFSGTGAQLIYTLANNPGLQANTQVYVGGVYQNKSTYTVVGTTLTFSEAPPSGTNNIEVMIVLATPVGFTDSASVTFLQSGTGAVTRTAQDEFREMVKVTQFGADPTGVADSTAAIQAAITFAVLTNGRKVYLPVGTYKISNPGLTVPTGVWLIGDSATPVGPGTVIVPASAAVTRMIAMTGVDAGLENILLLGEATKAVIGVDIGHATVSDPTTPGRLTFRNVVARQCKWGYHTLNGAFLLRWESCVGWDCLKGWYFDNTGAFLARGVNIASLENCHGVSNDQHGLLSVASLAVTVDSCGFDSEVEGIRAEDTLGLCVSNTTMDLSSTASFSIIGCTFDIQGCVLDQSQLPFTIQTGSTVSKGTIRHCKTSATVGLYSATPATDQWIEFVENTFDKAIQNDGQRFGHGDRTEANSGSVTAGGATALLTQAVTFSRAFSSIRSVVVVPVSQFTRRVNTLVASVTASGFTVEFQRDDGGTWAGGDTQAYYWIAIGTN